MPLLPFLLFAAADCTPLLQKQDPAAVAACKQQFEEADKGQESKRMERIIADDEYGVALLGIAHEPNQALDMFDREISLLPMSTVKRDSLQWAVTYWHRATAYQQLGQMEKAGNDLSTAESTFTKAIAAAGGDPGLTQHLTELRQRVRAQHADILDRQGKHAEAESLRATQ